MTPGSDSKYGSVEMRVLAVYPAFDTEINEMAMAWLRLCQVTNTHCTVFTGCTDRLKGRSSSVKRETRENLDIYRFEASKLPMSVLMPIARLFKPDVIFCAVAQNLPVALALRRETGAPIILHTEFFVDDTEWRIVQRRYYLGFEPLRPLVSDLYRRWVAHNTSRILCSNPVEPALTKWQCYPSLGYLPWPQPEGLAEDPARDRDPNLAVYIGSLSKAKGATTLARYFTHLLTVEPNMKLSLVGPALDAEGRQTLETLRTVGGKRVQILSHCTRPEAVALLVRALFVLSPGRRLGWGLIGDAWANGTPVLSPAVHYDLRPGENCLLVSDPTEFCRITARLRTDSELWHSLSVSGRKTVESAHSIQKVAQLLHEEVVTGSDLAACRRAVTLRQAGL
jgi:glycosyltransferase involved in cell wall biosynthesis